MCVVEPSEPIIVRGEGEQMKRAAFVAILVGVLLFFGFAAAGAWQNVRLFVNGREIYPDVPPQIINGRTMVPLRAVAEALGADVRWDDVSNAVIITKQNENPQLPNEFITLLKQDPKLTQILMQVGTLLKADPSLAGDIAEAIKKHYSQTQTIPPQNQPQYMTPSLPVVPQQVPPAYSNRDNAIATIKAEAEKTRRQIRAKANELRTQVESAYQGRKSYIDRQKEDALRSVDEEMNRRGILQSGIRDNERQKVEDYYAYYYNQLNAWKDGMLDWINNWESKSLSDIDNWEAQTLQSIQ